MTFTSARSRAALAFLFSGLVASCGGKSLDYALRDTGEDAGSSKGSFGGSSSGSAGGSFGGSSSGLLGGSSSGSVGGASSGSSSGTPGGSSSGSFAGSSSGSVGGSSSGSVSGSSSGVSMEDGGAGTCGLGTEDGQCSPEPLGTCVPTYVPPAGGKGSCTAADVATFNDDCVMNFMDCTGSDLSSQACYHCLYSASTDSAWGVVVAIPDSEEGPAYILNTAGCLAATGASEACASATAELDECEFAACGNSCLSATDDVALACYNAAENGECASYFAASNASCAGDDAGACADPGIDGGSADFQASYLLMAQAMCE